MSVKAVTWAFEQRLKPSVKMVLLALCDYAGEHGEAYPSIKTLELKTSLERKAIFRSLKFLKDGQYIEDTGERRGATKQITVYRMGPQREQSPKGNSPQLVLETVPKREQVEEPGTIQGTVSEPSVHGAHLNSPRAVGKEKVEMAEIVRELTLQYPGVNVEAQIPSMNRWLARNPSRRMTKRFIQRWLDTCDVEIEQNGQRYQTRGEKSGEWNGEDLQHRKYSEFDYVSRESYEEHCRKMAWKPIYE
jgi:hypothetical protein